VASRLRACRSCDRYTLKDRCPVCTLATISPHPMRYSPQDRYGAYRRRLKRLVAEREG
jgi:H/ACA ribonucleoprotein complex subunit 3